MSKSSSATGLKVDDRKQPKGGGSFTRDPKTGALKRAAHTKAVAPRAQAKEAARASSAAASAKTSENQEG